MNPQSPIWWGRISSYSNISRDMLTDKFHLLKKDQSPFNLQTDGILSTNLSMTPKSNSNFRQYKSSHHRNHPSYPLRYYTRGTRGSSYPIHLRHCRYAQKSLKPAVIQQEISQPDLSLIVVL